MPRQPTFRLPAIADLQRQLEYAPRETRWRQMDAAERLAREIDSAADYPVDFIVFKVTGYRPESAGGMATVPGAMLRRDLATLVVHLSRASPLKPTHAGRIAIHARELAGRMGVSNRTVQRFRELGLVLHVIEFKPGEAELGCFEDALEHFQKTQQPRLAAAAAFTRMSTQERGQIIDDARALVADHRLSLHQAARELAKRYKRGVETMRQVLRQHEARSQATIFDDRAPMSERDARFAMRAWQRGHGLKAIAQRLGKSSPTIHRVLMRVRMHRLAGLELTWHNLPTFARADADSVILAPRVVRTGLDRTLPDHDASLFVLAALQTGEQEREETSALLAARNYLLKQAAEVRDDMKVGSVAIELDRAETCLRHVTMIDRVLVSAMAGVAVRRVEVTIGRPVPALPAQLLRDATLRVIAIVMKAISTADPARDIRLPRLVAQLMDRDLAQRPVADQPGKAGAHHTAGAVPLGRPLGHLHPWDPWLMLRSDLAIVAIQTAVRHWELVVERFGLTGEPPRTIDWLAARHHAPLPRIVQRIQQAVQAIRQRVRAEQQVATG